MWTIWMGKMVLEEALLELSQKLTLVGMKTLRQ